MPTAQPVKIAVLATTDISNAEIGALLYISEDTVKTHLRKFFAKHEIHDRASIACKMLVTGFMRIITYCEELDITDAEYEIIDYVASGMTTIEIAEQLALSMHTIKSHLARVSRRNHMGMREQLALNILLSGQVEP